MKLGDGDLRKISADTLDHYDQRAEDFWSGTRGHDVSQNIAALLRHIVSKPPATILDFGCGPGRDLAAFAKLGHTAIGKYRLLSLLGSGSNGEVFLAEPIRHPKQRVVVKRIHDHAVQRPKFHQLFEADSFN